MPQIPGRSVKTSAGLVSADSRLGGAGGGSGVLASLDERNDGDACRTTLAAAAASSASFVRTCRTTLAAASSASFFRTHCQAELPHLRGPADQSMAAVEQIMLDRINAVLFPQREAGLAPCLANLVLRHLSPTRARPHMVELASIICEWVIA
jgi:hypothetical protein